MYINETNIKDKKNLIAVATLGTVLEWAEFTFFAYMAPFISVIFFPENNHIIAKLKVYAIFALSYFMRPIGAIIFGHLGDRFGRKAALIGSMGLMSISTMAIGLLPTYATIGPIAALLLLFFRLLQGVAVAGEFNGASIYLIEHFGQDKKYFISSFTAFASALGMVLGSLGATLCSHFQDQLPFIWRIPFLSSALLAILALIIRSKLKETPEFNKMRTNNKLLKYPLIYLLKNNKIQILATLSLAMFISVYVYIGNIYYMSILMSTGITKQTASLIITFGQTLAFIAIVICGIYADKVGGLKMMKMGLAMAIISGPIIILCGLSGQISLAIFGQILYGIADGLFCAPVFAVINDKFTTQSRYTGASFSWSIGAAIFGGTALIIAQKLFDNGYTLGPGLYISIAAIIAIVITNYITKNDNLRTQEAFA